MVKLLHLLQVIVWILVQLGFHATFSLNLVLLQFKMAAAQGNDVVWKSKLDRIPECRAIKKGLTSVIIELGFTIKAVSFDMSFTPDSSPNSGSVNSTVRNLNICMVNSTDNSTDCKYLE